MANNRGIGAVVTIASGDKKIKYSIENDGIINVKTSLGAEYKEVRLVGTNHAGDAIRVIGEDGPSEIPFKIITAITDAKKLDFPCVTTI